MRILMVASEAAPFAKTGGLADVVAALPRALARLGHGVDVIVPRYRGVESGEPLGRVDVPLGRHGGEARLSAHRSDGVRTLLVEHPAYFERTHLYGSGGQDYDDNPARFGFLSRTAAVWAARAGERYDVVHAHDWQTGLVPVFLRRGGEPALASVPVVFTIHNLAYQGLADPSWLPALGLDWELMGVDGLEFWGRASLLKAGIVYSHALTTVSPQYAQEIQGPEYGCGLEGLLRDRSADLVGILNGIDYDQWDPARDPYLPEPFDASRLDGKTAAKKALLRRCGWTDGPADLRRPIVGLISRMVDQKGFDLLEQVSSEIPRLGSRVTVLGTGEPRYEALWRSLAAQHPDQVATTIGFSEEWAHAIEGGADLFLMPSRFEPCGLNQMYSQRYGTVPVVRATGGLRDTVIPFDRATGGGTGFTFDEYSAEALLVALTGALRTYEDPATWRGLQLAGMRQDFSWDRSARQYVSLYERAGRGGARTLEHPAT
jgi:starch synthase